MMDFILIHFEVAAITLTSVWITSVDQQSGHGALTTIHVTKLSENSVPIYSMIAHVMPREYFISRSSHQMAIMNVMTLTIAKFTRHVESIRTFIV